MPITQSYQDVDESSLAQIATNLAANLKIGDVIALTGDLGAGKTTFTKHLVNSLSISPQEVTSPTFNIVQIYNTEHFDIWHFDLYRLEKTMDLYQIGIEQAMDDGVSIIEWPQIATSLLPKKHIKINITVGTQENQRNVTIDH